MICEFAATNQVLAIELDLKSILSVEQLNPDNAIFDYENDQLVLHLLLDGKPSILKFDLSQGEVAQRAIKVSKSNEVVAKAIGCKPHYRPSVLDATAGMGRDSLIMAMLGCRVVMQERNFAIYHLLKNALTRLKENRDFKKEVSDRISLFQNNSLSENNCISANNCIPERSKAEDIDVIYLDPMFPERKKSALVKKEMRLFKLIAGEDPDADELLINSLQKNVKRVVVKRPKGAPCLANKKPSHEIVAKKFRYDVYLL